MSKGKKKKKRKPKKHLDRRFFEDFWQRYPENRRIAKQAAWSNWLTLMSRKVPAVDLSVAAENYAIAVQSREATYILHPTTFLAKGRWMDYVDGIPESERPPERPDPDKAIKDLEARMKREGRL